MKQNTQKNGTNVVETNYLYLKTTVFFFCIRAYIFLKPNRYSFKGLPPNIITLRLGKRSGRFCFYAFSRSAIMREIVLTLNTDDQMKVKVHGKFQV